MCKDITFLCITFKPTNFPGDFRRSGAELEFGFKTLVCSACQLMEAANEMRSSEECAPLRGMWQISLCVRYYAT